MGAIDTIEDFASPEILAVAPKAGLLVRTKAFAKRVLWGLKINRTRIVLTSLTDDQLADIGLSRHEAEREARKFSLF